MIVVLALGVAIGTMIMATPATAHFQASISHIAKHMKQIFYTKSQSNARYVRATGVLTIPGVAFVETTAGTPTGGSCIPETVAGNGTYYAPVNLPQGVRVTRLTHFWWDADASDSTASLVRVPLPATDGPFVMAAASSSLGDAVHTSSTTTTVTDAVINNNTNSYFVRVTQPGAVCIDAIQIFYRRP
jgi:hypothetical protein